MKRHDSEPRLYQLIRQRTCIADRQFEIEFLITGVQAFARRLRNSGQSRNSPTLQRPTHYGAGQRPWGDLAFFGELLEMK
jgi:hypothetical protein